MLDQKYHNKRTYYFTDQEKGQKIYLRTLTNQGAYHDKYNDSDKHANKLYEEISYRVNEAIKKIDDALKDEDLGKINEKDETLAKAIDRDVLLFLKLNPTFYDKIKSTYNPNEKYPNQVQFSEYKDSEKNYSHFILENEKGEALSALSIRHENKDGGKRAYIDYACTDKSVANSGYLGILMHKTLSTLTKNIEGLEDIYIGTRTRGKYAGNMGRYVGMFESLGIKDVTIRDRIELSDINRLLDPNYLAKDIELKNLAEEHNLNDKLEQAVEKKTLENIIKKHPRFKKLDLSDATLLSKGKQNINEILKDPKQNIFVHGTLQEHKIHKKIKDEKIKKLSFTGKIKKEKLEKNNETGLKK